MASKQSDVRRIDELFSRVHKCPVETTSTNDPVGRSIEDDNDISGTRSITEAPNSSSPPNGPPYPDVGFMNKADLKSDDTRRKILQGEWNDCHKFKFPSRVSHGSKRKFSHVHLVSHKWLRYSVTNDSVYCAYCVVYGKDGIERSQFATQEGVTNWSNIGRLVQQHSKSSNHLDSLTKGASFLCVFSGSQRDIYSQLSSEVQDTVERNRKIIEAIIDTVILCGKQNIALRGHSEQSSNFLSLLKFRAKTDAILASHLQNASSRAKYTSPRIQNEIIDICGNYIRKSLVNDCNKSPCYAFLADEATDSATMEEIAICVRFLKPNEKGTVEVQEEFLGLVHTESTKGEALARKFLEVQNEYGIDTRKMRAQGYDGAANMAGIHRGVQAIIRQSIPEAVYVHCKAHSLNLAIGHACKEPLVRNMLNTLQQVAFAFDYSAKRLLAFKEALAQDDLAREEMQRRSKLRTLCETRWSSRADSLFTFRAAFTVVVQALEELIEDGDAKARGHLCSIKQFDFIIALCAT